MVGFVVCAFVLPVVSSVTGSGTFYFGGIATAGVFAAVILVILCAIVLNLKCPCCGDWYFVTKGVRSPLLACRAPILRKPCPNCGCDAFRK